MIALMVLKIRYIQETYLEEIDKTISDNLSGWTLKRISKIALAVLRLAVYEIKYVENIPVGVSINEAVEIAKKYGSDNDRTFVNGILGSIARKNENE